MLAYEVGDDFMQITFIDAAQGKLGPFMLVVEGSIPDENNKQAGYWAAMGTDPATGQPITTCEWIDRLAPNAWAIVAAGTCATYGGIHAMAGNPTGAWAWRIIFGWDWRSRAGIPIVNVPGCPVQPDNFMETLLYLLYQAAGRAPMIPLDDCTASAAGCSNRRCTRAAIAADTTSKAISRSNTARSKCIVKLGCWGPVVQCNVGKRGWMGGVGGCPNVGGDLHRLHDARVSRQVHAVHG